MFSPSQLIQSMVQRAPVSSPKPVELTPGQVFKGTVIKQYPDNMALVQIGGMQVQAKLEAKLEQGQKAWLQVQPSAEVVTLKVLDTPVEGPGKEASMEGLIRSLGLPETKESRVIVATLMNANLPVTKEAVQAFTAVATRLGTDDATVEAFMMAVKRNLPLTPDTVAGLKAFLAEKPISQVIQNFLQQASQFLDKETEASLPSPMNGKEGRTGQADGVIRQLVMNLREKVQALPVAITNPGESDQPVGTTQSQVNRTPVEGQASQVLSQTASGANASTSTVKPSAQLNLTQQAMAAETSSQTANATITDMPDDLSSNQFTRLGQRDSQFQPESNTTNTRTLANSVNAPALGTHSQAQSGISQGGAAKSAGGVQPADLNNNGQQQLQTAQSKPVEKVIAQPVDGANQRTTTAVQSANGAPASAASGTHPIQELFRQMGIAHERDLMGHTLAGATADAGAHRQMESVKSMLLQLTQTQAHTVPAALREAADQLLQQVTGQQLMMLQPTSQALSQIVMQIPIRSAQGEETAYVQIESKKKGGGQVDAENCRLFFHLELQSMGTTMIDVSIVNRIVNLQIFNDLPWVDTFVQGMKSGFAEQLQEVGYSLSSVRVQSIPEQRTKSSLTNGAKGAIMSDYKGVDLRV
ncbi:hypothetical protein [Brevibacillus choshinensis]|uniref:hypothetical protein n=1 Tax=Brevibacillus choshinensis TaxID=54911 RepID=UPI002E246751|nr:hypothetical protein [Brevibacillus choshinensis]